MRAVVLILSLCSVMAFAEAEVIRSTQKLKCRDRLLLNVYEIVPEGGDVVADQFFLHGFGDTGRNHLERAKRDAKEGIRTVIFDYPSHGSKGGWPNWYDLNRYKMHDLALITAELVASHSPDMVRPLFLSGWSTGATLALYVIQNKLLGVHHGRVRGQVLVAPGLPVKVPPGRLGFLTRGSLSSNPDPAALGDITMCTPFQVLCFALDLSRVSKVLADSGDLVKVPTLLLSAGRDEYVDTDGTHRWGDYQREVHGQVWEVYYPQARHAILAEPNGISEDAERRIQTFIWGGLDGRYIHHLGQPNRVTFNP